MPSKNRGRNRAHRRKHRKMDSGGSSGEGEPDLGNELGGGDTELLLDRMTKDKPTKISRRPPSEPPQDGEGVWSITIQVFIPFLVAGLGMVGAGLVLDIVQHWPVFRVISEVFILVPALLGLKGNLEMTLASRLSTHANLGHMDNPKEQWSMIIGNLSLIQCQAIVVGFLASLAAMVMGWVPEGKFNIDHGLLLCASSLVTASLASFVLGLVMVAVIVLSRHCHVNPDNVATPIAASLGDLTTLALLAWISSLLYDAIGNDQWLAPLIIIGGILLTPVWAWIASRNPYTREVLSTGWVPVISAMVISSIGGLILDFTVSNFKGIAVFQPVINGVGGNLVAVQASRISTSLHKDSKIGRLPSYESSVCMNPWSAFCKPVMHTVASLFSILYGSAYWLIVTTVLPVILLTSSGRRCCHFKLTDADTEPDNAGGHARTARVLLIMVIPGHLIFSYTISYLQAGHTTLTPIFVGIYLFAALLQVVLLLYFAHVMIHWMWVRKIDPDNSAIPYLTALGDLLGTGLLAIAFKILYVIGDKDSDVGD